MGKRDRLLIRADNMFCGFHNLLIMINDLIARDDYDYKINNELMREKNEGEICFIIGNGPSLRNVDFSLIKNYPSITVNGFYEADLSYKSKYHLFLDPDYNNSICHDHIYKLLDKNPEAILIISREIKNTIKSIKGNLDRVFVIKDSKKQVGNVIHYDLTKEITGSINVIPVAIECAMFMGYRKICLLGCDFSMYTQVKGVHFYDDNTFENEGDVKNIYENNVGNLIRCALVHKQHYSIQNVAKNNHCTIVNATDGSLIDAYPFINLNDFIGGNK